MKTPTPAALAQMGDVIELLPNEHTAGRTSLDRVAGLVRDYVIHVQTYAPGDHPLSPIRDDYVARQVTTRSGSVWRGHPRGGRYRGPEIRHIAGAGVSFEMPWAAPIDSHGAMPRFTLVPNRKGVEEDGIQLGILTNEEEAMRNAQAYADTYQCEVALFLDNELLREFGPK